MKFNKPVLLILFWCVLALTGLWVPLACTNTSSNYLPTHADITVVPSATATNMFGYTSTPTFTLQPTLTATNTPIPAPAMTGAVSVAGPLEPNGVAVYGSAPVSIFSVGSDGTLSIFQPLTPTPVYSSNPFSSPILASPESVAIDVGNSCYYVVDSTNNAVYQFNLSTNQPMNTWNSWGSGNVFSGPEGVAVDSAHNVYVSDTGHDQIDVFTAGGATSTYQWGILGDGNGAFDNPSGLAVSGSTLYVSDASNQLIQEFSLTGTFQTQFSTVANSDIFGIAVDGSGNVYAADYNQADLMIEKYSSGGTLIKQWNGPGGTFGPSGVAYNSANSLLYVADHDNNAIESLNP